MNIRMTSLQGLKVLLLIACVLILFTDWFGSERERFLSVSIMAFLFFVFELWLIMRIRPFSYQEVHTIFYLDRRKRITIEFFVLTLLLPITVFFAYTVLNDFWVFIVILELLRFSSLLEDWRKQKNGHYNLIVTQDKIIANEDRQKTILIQDIENITAKSADTYIIDQGLQKDTEYIYVKRIRKDQREDLIRCLEGLSGNLNSPPGRGS